MSTQSVYSRIIHRETTSPRATLAITLAIIIILLIAYAVAETILSLIGQPSLLASPADMGIALVNAPNYLAGVMIAVGILAVLLGLILMIAAVKPGRRPRHVLDADRVVVVVDDEVIGSALARHASYEGNIDPDNARVSVSRRRAVVRLTPASGTSIGVPAVDRVVTEQLERYGLRPTIRSKVVVDERGKVGA